MNRRQSYIISLTNSRIKLPAIIPDIHEFQESPYSTARTKIINPTTDFITKGVYFLTNIAGLKSPMYGELSQTRFAILGLITYLPKSISILGSSILKSPQQYQHL